MFSPSVRVTVVDFSKEFSQNSLFPSEIRSGMVPWGWIQEVRKGGEGEYR